MFGSPFDTKYYFFCIWQNFKIDWLILEWYKKVWFQGDLDWVWKRTYRNVITKKIKMRYLHLGISENKAALLCARIMLFTCWLPTSLWSHVPSYDVIRTNSYDTLDWFTQFWNFFNWKRLMNYLMFQEVLMLFVKIVLLWILNQAYEQI